ncbi:ABC transporter ATP-binding protein [Microbacterium azadirachtae]|uniref:Spermidine/putrescine import ATP-binding protein PotA n=1 Tax=Microbacterium azadirachtae TaxID=582680 RepID=A0A0F0KQX2_9MICO|nr:ABC transporter ATP-binding protein [Microbacterium azadirachtae]KJL21646.1 Spermidine/putrescine import ATP-binding protein PotA [Microbacterium azadirachtae]UXW84959.1 ABC transporter ATP-binding protein [Microbacterium azadirachtae]SDM03905.1 spermidine/putrescine transport system ATP-binding protein [Microbacterium azadirachtae]SEG29418.1 spermidine/putrescine transport system ATP-binding protein [Microbacterium azadirachtae]SEG32356.1 spermidine/putrescine transport system ATP-binding 
MSSPVSVSAQSTTDAPTGGVEISGVTKYYGDATAVDRLSLSIRPGEFLSLLGPSGCGKTTTLRMIAGFEHPDAGDIRLSGRSVLGLPPHKREVNTVFQAYALFPHMTVAENVAYGLQQRKVSKAEQRERVAEALDMVQLRRFADRKPTQLSGGQQQRIALSRALINRPSVLLLDEPLAALDRQLREEMQLELKLLQSRLGTTFVFVTHDQAEALSMSDRIAVMRAGRIEQLAAPADIYAEPASAYVASFIGQQNFLHGTALGGDAVDTFAGALRGRWGGEQGLPGSTAVAAIRPEFVRLAPAGTAEGPGVDGTVLGVSHLGETLQVAVDVGREQAFLVRIPAPGAPSVAVGDAVRCTWDPADVRIFADDGIPETATHVIALPKEAA